MEVDSPQDQEEQESGHQGHHGNTVAQVVDNEGDSVMQVIIPLLDRQTGMGRQKYGYVGVGLLFQPFLS